MLINKAHSKLSVLSDEHALSDDQLDVVVGGVASSSDLPILSGSGALKPLVAPINRKTATEEELAKF